MSSEKPITKGTEPDVFGRTLLDAGSSDEHQYLADPRVAHALLSDVLQQAMFAVDSERFAALVETIAMRTARTFLGGQADYVPLRKWNEPGGIDVFLAKWLGVDELDPTRRVAGAIVAMLEEAMDIAVDASSMAAKARDWQWRIDELLDRYAALFIGLDQTTMMIL